MLRRIAPFTISLLFASAARADVVAVHPGMTMVRDGTSAMIIANLCAPGVSMRATRFSERQATPEQWGQSVGVQAAINADFFDFPGWSYVLVRARGAGEEWPASAEKLEQPSGYWQFGPGISGIQGSSLVSPGANVTDVVGAYDPIIGFGGVVDQSADPFMQEFHRRSAIGLSWDAATIYLYASNAAIDGVGMANEMMALAAEAGAPAIGFATNQDGGGSSQLYVDGFGQVIDSGRQVIDHLGIYASGSGAAPNCPNRAPKGYLDGVACDGFAGWAQDPDAPEKSIAVQFEFDGIGPMVANANVSRQDLCAPLGSCTHAFTPLPPPAMLDGKPHVVHAFAMDSGGGARAELAESPRTMTCSAGTLTGVRRHVTSPAALAAWKLGALDVLAMSDDAFGKLPSGKPLPDAPTLLHADDASPEFWVVDGTEKRHIVDPASADAWRFDLTSAEVKPAAYVASLATGLPWPARPFGVHGSGAEIDILDTSPSPLPSSPDAGAPPSDVPGAASEGCSCREGGAAQSPLFLGVFVALALARRRHSSGVIEVQRRNARANARPSE